MLNRQFIPPLRTSASAVDGTVLPRPATRLFSETRPGQVMEPLVKSPVGCDQELGSSPGGAPPDGGQTGAEGNPLATDELVSTSDVDATVLNGSQTDAPEIAEASGLVAADPAVAEPVEGAPDLTGYGAYDNIPTPVASLSRDELVTRYAHLVKYVVGRLGVSVPGLFDHEDAMQAGVLGLLRAIDAYKPEAAASFESYAILRIRGAILDAVRSLDTVGRAGREAARAIQGAIRDLQHELGRSPTESEIAERLGMPVARYRERLQAASVVTISLDEHDSRDGDDDSPMLADNAPDPNAVDPADEAARRDAIAGLVAEIGRLSQRSRMVVALYYQDEMTFKEIGQVLGVTESRVCQIHTEAILALRSRIVDPDVAARLGRRRARS